MCEHDPGMQFRVKCSLVNALLIWFKSSRTARELPASLGSPSPGSTAMPEAGKAGERMISGTVNNREGAVHRFLGK